MDPYQKNTDTLKNDLNNNMEKNDPRFNFVYPKSLINLITNKTIYNRE